MQAKNIILEFVKNELKLDHCVMKEVVLIRIDEETLFNPLIAEFAKNYQS